MTEDVTPIEPPQTSYVLWYTPRTGSNLLCDLLRFTECAGDPHELLSTTRILNLLPHYQVGSYADAQQALWKAGTKNGVFGMKCQMYDPSFTRILHALRQFPGGDQMDNEGDLWSNAFPNCRHIAVTRRNKVRQAVSWYRATQSKEWTREPGAPPPVRDVSDLYDQGAISHYVFNAVMGESKMAEFFSSEGITPLTVVYEDVLADSESAVRRILDFLGLNAAEAKRRSPILERQADELSEAWVQRYRAEAQEGWVQRW